MENKQRLTGIDLFRGIAVYAVAILHSGNGLPVTTVGAEILSHLSGFAVPFFLATSFYLAISKLYNYRSKYFLNTRLARLLIPYCIWSVVYLVYKGFKYWISNKPEQLDKVLQDPVSLIFLGGTGYHLYFIPLLLAGTLLVKVAEYLIRKQIKLKTLFILVAASVFAYEVLLLSGNSFHIGPKVAFEGLLGLVLPNGNSNPLLRLALVEVAWICRCLPYIFMAMLLSYISIEKQLLKLNCKYTAFLFAIFFVINAFSSEFIPESIYELARGYLCLIFAIVLSNNLRENYVITNLGLCSFGIYLMHLIVIELLKILANRMYPAMLNEVSVLSLLMFATPSFLLSWLATSLLICKQKSASKLVVGV